MNQLNEQLIRNVVTQVLAEVNQGAFASPQNHVGKHGVFLDANDAVDAANKAFEELSRHGMETRKQIIDHIRRISIDQCVELGTMEMEETKIGRLDHKIEKLKTLGARSPGTEFMSSQVFSGDRGHSCL